MEMYDVYKDEFKLGDKRDVLQEGDIITDPNGEDYVIFEMDKNGEWMAIEPEISFPFTRKYMSEEYNVHYCSWDERWYVWGTKWNLSFNDKYLGDAVRHFEKLIAGRKANEVIPNHNI